jgi:lipid II:glycine glycyltransferase (peptidoglycan interpeptide bridge formation enzyme)
MPNVVVIDPRKDPRWDEFVNRHEYGTIFHLSAWCNVLKTTFGYNPCYLVIENNQKEIQAGLPVMLIKSWITGRRLISLPRTSYCDPLVKNTEEMSTLIAALHDLSSRKKAAYFELKPQYNSEPLSAFDLKHYCYFLNQVLILEDDPQKLWRKFHRTCVQQRITKAEKQDVVVRFGKTEEDLKLFYNLHRKTTDDHSVPPRPYSFFEAMWRVLFPQNLLMLAIAEVNGHAAVAGLFLQYKNILYYEFVGIDHAYTDKSPAHLLLWETLKVACANGMKYLDFGLTPVNNKGLITYKKRWGAQEKPLYYFYYPDIKGYKVKAINAVPDNDSAPTFLHRLKDHLKKTAAARLYKHFG